MEIFEQATLLHQQGRFAEAEVLYDQILTQNQDNAGLLATMGTLYLATGKMGLAISMMERSLEKAKKRNPDVLSNLGIAYKNSGLHDKALKYLEEGASKPDASATSITNYGAMFMESENNEKAKKLFYRALDIEPELPMAHWNLALAMLENGEWDKAWDEHEWGLKTGVKSCQRNDRKIADLPWWDGSPGKKVAVYGEQGIGDEIMFASMIPDMMKTNGVVLECHTRLQTLFEKSFGIPCYGTREDDEISWPQEHPDLDARIAIGSLGKFYRRSRDAFPGHAYLKADPLLPRGDRFRVGLSWTGGMKAGRVMKRTVPLSWWKSILNNNCEFVSLQYTDCDEEIKIVENSGYEIRQFREAKAQDYYEAARLVKSCDLVISVCTSAVHLAGALGVPCWVMTPKYPAWRYQRTGGMPWYRSVRLYRQPEAETAAWIPVVERIGLDLSDLLSEKQRKTA